MHYMIVVRAIKGIDEKKAGGGGAALVDVFMTGGIGRRLV